MVFSTLTILEINPLPLFGPTGDVKRWGEARKNGIVAKAKVRAPLGTRTRKSPQNAGEPVGSLKAGIGGSYSRVGPLQFSVEIRSKASYSVYVIKGTPPIIRSKGQARINGRFALGSTRKTMFLPGNLGYSDRYVSQVRGQKANDFISAAVDAEAARHPALLGYDRT